MKTGTFIYTMLALVAVSCGKLAKSVDNPQPSVYYWRTTLTLDETERTFLQEAKVGKMFLHVFDIVKAAGTEDLIPANTLIFEDRIPDNISIIPTVFIAPDALKGIDKDACTELAERVVKRIDQMMAKNGYATTKEIQIDYDWISSDETVYFDFLSKLRDKLHAEGRTLSATIRLHQLALPAPPADYGVLMVYNVGKFSDVNERNSILTAEAVVPYLPKLSDYALPLCTALPIYGWDLLFHDNTFQQIVRGINLADTTHFRQTDSIHYLCTAYSVAPTEGVADQADGRIYPGDIIRHEQPDIALLKQVKQLLTDYREGICDQIVIYHLDRKFITNNSNELKNLYSDN